MVQGYNKKAREGNSFAGFRHFYRGVYFVSYTVLCYMSNITNITRQNLNNGVMTYFIRRNANL